MAYLILFLIALACWLPLLITESKVEFPEHETNEEKKKRILRNARKEAICDWLVNSFATALAIAGIVLIFSIIVSVIMPYQYDEHYAVTESYDLAITGETVWIQGDDMSFQKLRGDYSVIGKDTCESPRLETHQYSGEASDFVKKMEILVSFSYKRCENQRC